jgi:hypothetical protein
MATFALNPASIVETTAVASTGKPSFFGRFMDALVESRQRQAEREIRRVRALYGEPKERLDYAMLPFAGE